MTFQEFQATGRDVADLVTIAHIAASGIDGRGRAYVDDLFITGTELDGWSVLIGNTAKEFTILEYAERELFEFAVSEGYISSTD